MSTGPQAPRRLLLVAPYFGPQFYGGAVVVYRGLFAHLPGWEVHVAAAAEDGDTEAHDLQARNEQGLHIHRIPGLLLREQIGWAPLRLLRGLGDLLAARRELLALRAQLQPRLLVCGNVLELAWMAGLSRRLQPDLNYVHGEELTLPTLGRGVAVLLKRLQPRLLRAARLNLAVSGSTLRRLLALGLDETRVRLLPNFVDCSYYRPADDLEALRARMGVAQGLVFVSIARLIRRKGIDDLLRALALLREQARLPADLQLRLIGDGPERGPLQALAASLELSGQVEFCGRLPSGELLQQLQACDALVMPNKNVDGDDEGFGLVFLEANACGKPVLGGASGGVPDAVEDGVSGLLARPGDVADIAERLAQLIESAELRAALGTQGLARARQHFDLEARRAELRQLLDVLAGCESASRTHSRQGRSLH